MRLILPLLLAAAVAGPAFAQDSTADASAASGAAAQSVSLLGASGVKTALAASVVAVSAAAVGASVVGGVALVAGAQLNESAKASERTALKVDDAVIIAPDPAPKVPYQAQKK